MRTGERLHCPHDPLRTAVSGDDTDHRTQEEGEDHDGGVIRVGYGRHDEQVDESPGRRNRVESDDEESAEPDAREESCHDLPEDQRERDGQERGAEWMPILGSL